MTIDYQGKKIKANYGDTVGKVLKEEIEKSKYQVIECRYNNEYKNLETEIIDDAKIELIDTSTKEGMKV